MPWQDGVEVTDELVKAVIGWEGKLNNFLKSLDAWRHSHSKTEKREPSVADQQLLSALEKAKGDVDTALRDSFNTSAVMRILSDLVTESNSAEALSEQTIILLARWVTRVTTIFGLDPEGDLSDPDRIGWSGLDIPAPAKPYIYPASQLRDKVRILACAGSVDHAAIAELADGITIAAPPPAVESSSDHTIKCCISSAATSRPSRPSKRRPKTCPPCATGSATCTSGTSASISRTATAPSPL
jgi:cysteinyl-tRNA synthetase